MERHASTKRCAQRATSNEQQGGSVAATAKVLKLGGKVLKLSMWMGALILAGLVQGAPDAQDVFGPQGGRHSAFRSQELGVRRLFGRGMGAGCWLQRTTKRCA